MEQAERALGVAPTLMHGHAPHPADTLVLVEAVEAGGSTAHELVYILIGVVVGRQLVQGQALLFQQVEA